MNIYPLNVKNYTDLNKICSRIKTDSRAFTYLYPKSNILHFYAEKIDYRAAAFLKQELLARGGDTIVTKHVIDGKTDFSDVLLMATDSQLKRLLEKLKSMDCWGLKEFRENLSASYNNMKIHEWKLKSPNGHEIILNEHTKLMAIINLTPDSFFEPSRIKENEILERAEKFLNEGAEILDLGAESTRPGATRISEAEELERLLPALKIVRKNFPDAAISIDTYKSETAKIAFNEGADIINDVSGFCLDDEMINFVNTSKIPYVLSHYPLHRFTVPLPVNGEAESPLSKGRCQTQSDREVITERLLIGEINSYFREKLKLIENHENIILDPGLGFGKNEIENCEIIKNIESLKIFGLPVLIGHSMKRFTGKNLSATLAVTGILSGRVNILRVHDVKENKNALSMAEKIYTC
ncbi:MAG: dihydropteroate synthase [Synergistaceae bacterium]|nr:dihydropteroate synthase [Synergistaceae bacterium]